jgi:hypothetical protein
MTTGADFYPGNPEQRSGDLPPKQSGPDGEVYYGLITLAWRDARNPRFEDRRTLERRASWLPDIVGPVGGLGCILAPLLGKEEENDLP